MRKLFPIPTVVLLWPLAASWAQLYAPNEMGVSLGQWYTSVRDVEITKKFWLILGGTPIKVDGMDVIKFPGVLVFLKPGTPSGGRVGTPVNHVGFQVQNVINMLDKWESCGRED